MTSSSPEAEVSEGPKSCLKRSKYGIPQPRPPSPITSLESKDQNQNYDSCEGVHNTETCSTPKRGRTIFRKTWKSLRKIVNREPSKERSGSGNRIRRRRSIPLGNIQEERSDRSNRSRRRRSLSLGGNKLEEVSDKGNRSRRRRSLSLGGNKRALRNRDSSNNFKKKSSPWPGLQTSSKRPQACRETEKNELKCRSNRSKHMPGRRHSCSSSFNDSSRGIRGNGVRVASRSRSLTPSRRRRVAANEDDKSGKLDNGDSERMRAFIDAVCADPNADVPNPFKSPSKKKWKGPRELREKSSTRASDNCDAKGLKSVVHGVKRSRMPEKAGKRNVVAIKVSREPYQENASHGESDTIVQAADESFVSKPKRNSEDAIAILDRTSVLRKSSSIYDMSTSSLFSETGWESAHLHITTAAEPRNDDSRRSLTR